MYKEGTFFAGEIPSEVAAWCNASFKYFLEPVEGGYILRSKGKEVLVNESIMLAQYYLSTTDWYAVRYAETGIPVPEDVKTKRQAAREEIDRLRTELAVINWPTIGGNSALKLLVPERANQLFTVRTGPKRARKYLKSDKELQALIAELSTTGYTVS